MRKRRTRAQPDTCWVVGIGASAGGISALQSLFQALPSEPNVALVVVQHLAPSHPSRLAELVSAWCALPVERAKDGVRPKRNRIYVARPEDVLTLESGVFRTRPVEGGRRRPGIDTVDAFLESLARDRGSRAMAVILSGTGADGSAGAIGVKRAGGVVLVQDPISAMHDSMPRAAIARGAADYVLPVGKIATQLALCASPEWVRPPHPVSWREGLTKTLDGIVGLIHKQAGFDLKGYKTSPLLWRIQQRMDARRVQTFEDYELLLRADPIELDAIVRGIPIHVTEFFRDPKAWDALSRDVIAPLVCDRNKGDTIRAWTPACATGEEAFSVAMLLSEHLEAAGKPVDFRVFATDASPDVLARASRGVFSARAIQGISAKRRSKFFHAVEGGFRVKRALREKMVFAPQDVLADPPFTSLDLVTCRNLLIYLDADANKRVLLLLHGSLRVGGCLFLGRGEPLSPRQKGFEPVSSHLHIYRKTGAASDVAIKLPRSRAKPAASLAREELAASREEMQALNEELRASNDQLNDANQDLHQANVQLEEKIAELEMQSRVLSSGAVMTLFLDEGMRVRWFTPAVTDLFPLRRGDAGRRITDLVQKFDDVRFVRDVADVMQHGAPREVEVRGDDGRWFLRTIRPYRAATGNAGVAVTFTETTVRKRELDDATRLQTISSLLLEDGKDEELWGPILDAAMAIMRADFGSMQRLDAERGTLRLVVWRNFHAESAAHWQTISVEHGTTCGSALKHGERVVVPDLQAFSELDEESRHYYALSGIRAVQSTPLTTRAGRVLGMISTHWRDVHTPKASELGFFDVLARQAAEFFERHRAQAEVDAVTVGRELRVTELEREVNALEREQGRPARYAELDPNDDEGAPSS